MLNIISSLASPIVDRVGSIIDQKVEDKDEANRLKAQLQSEVHTILQAQMMAQRDTIVAEAKGESWLQRNWRPLVMLWFAGLVGAHWLGYTAPNITEAIVLSLLGLVKIGLGGYVIGRSTEKVAKTVSQAGGFKKMLG